MIYVDEIKMLLKTLAVLGVLLLVTQACQPPGSGLIGSIRPAHAAEGLELGLMATQGDTDSATYTLDYEHKAGQVDLNASYRYVSTNDEITTRQGSAGAVYNYELSDRVDWWSSAQGGFNESRGIDGELFAGLGLTRYIVKNDKNRLSLSAGYLLQHTDYEDRAGESTHRQSYRLKATHKAGDTECGAFFLYQQSLSEPDDYRAISEAFYRVVVEERSIGSRKYTVAFEASAKDEYLSFTEGPRHESILFLGFKVRFE